MEFSIFNYFIQKNSIYEKKFDFKPKMHSIVLKIPTFKSNLFLKIFK